MEKKQALEQLQAIQAAINASNKIFFSGSVMISYGVLVLIIPLLEAVTDSFSFGVPLLREPVICSGIHVLFYWLAFAAVAHYFHRNSGHGRSANPAIRKALSVCSPILAAMFGTIIILNAIGHNEMTTAGIALFLGILFNLIGQFSEKIVRLASWSYILLGLALLYFSQQGIDWLWIVFTCWLGASYIVMGIVLKRGEYSACRNRT